MQIDTCVERCTIALVSLVTIDTCAGGNFSLQNSLIVLKFPDYAESPSDCEGV